MTNNGCGWLVLAVIMTGISCYLWLIIADQKLTIISCSWNTHNRLGWLKDVTSRLELAVK
jgi:hypothetical protein